MKHHDFRADGMGQRPVSATCLTVPGLDCSGPDHWQTLWEQSRVDCVRVDLACWHDPDLTIWRERLDQAVQSVTGPVVLVAHSLGCFAVAWWAMSADAASLARVRGALLVAPPDVDRPNIDARLRGFSPTPRIDLPFRAMLVASTTDRYASADRSRDMAASWGAEYLSVGDAGHINADSGLGVWPAGQALLDDLLRNTD